MRKLKKDNFFVPITDTEIKSFEQKYSISFPEYFKNFILEYNGSGVDEYIFKNKIDYVVNSFLPLLENKNSSIEQVIPMIQDKEMGIGHNDLIPFAIDPGGRFFLLSIGSEDSGFIYYSIFGFGEDNAIRKIANSLEEFIDGLQKEE